MFEYTSDELKERFKPNARLDIAGLSALPALLMAETSSGDEIARVATIVRVSDRGSDYELSYTYDPAVPPISNLRIESLAAELDIINWELFRTHWAVKDADLFYALLKASWEDRESGVAKPTPKVFAIGDSPVDDKLISVMIPFRPTFDPVFAAISETVRRMKRRCRRADDLWKNEAVIQDVVDLINMSRIVICDLSGKNSNVFYETGVAHTLGKDTILITQSARDVPFDLRHLRFIEYKNDPQGLESLSGRLQQRIKSLTAD